MPKLKKGDTFIFTKEMKDELVSEQDEGQDFVVGQSYKIKGIEMMLGDDCYIIVRKKDAPYYYNIDPFLPKKKAKKKPTKAYRLELSTKTITELLESGDVSESLKTLIRGDIKKKRGRLNNISKVINSYA